MLMLVIVIGMFMIVIRKLVFMVSMLMIVIGVFALVSMLIGGMLRGRLALGVFVGVLAFLGRHVGVLIRMLVVGVLVRRIRRLLAEHRRPNVEHRLRPVRFL